MSQALKNEQLLREVSKFDFVDALRGWAFLIVLVGHIDMHLVFHSPVSVFLSENIRYGVQLFFVVSAFTLFFSLYIRGHHRAGALRAFFIRRFFRIAPMFWLAVFFYLAVCGFKRLYWIPHEITLWRVLSTMLFMNGWHPDTINNVIPGGWTVAVEMNFYLLLPIFFKYITSLKKALLCVFFLLVTRIAADYFYVPLVIPPGYPKEYVESFLSFWLPNQLPVFALGFVLFFLVRDRLAHPKPHPDVHRQEKEGRLAWGLVVLFLFFFFSARFSNGKIFPSHVLAGGGFLFLGWALAIRPFSFFVNRFTNYVGKVSYSAYLWHFYIADIAVRILCFLGKKYDLPLYPDLYFFTILFFTLVVTLGVSALTYAWIEEPFQKLGKKIIHKIL